MKTPEERLPLRRIISPAFSASSDHLFLTTVFLHVIAQLPGVRKVAEEYKHDLILSS